MGPRESWATGPASLMCAPGKLPETAVAAACWNGCINMIYAGGFKIAFVKEILLLRNLWGSSKEKVDKHVCKHDPVDIVYNFQKASDKVPDQKLLRKLNRHGVRG